MNVIGSWEFNYNFDGSDNYHTTTLTVNSDGSWVDNTGGEGKWTLVGTLFTLNFNSGYTYSGLLSGGVVCGFNGPSGNPSPTNTSFYLVHKNSNILAQNQNNTVRTEQ